MEESTNRRATAPVRRFWQRPRCENCKARLRGRFCIRCGQRDLRYDRVVCDNCGAEKLGHFCAVCGQSDRNYQRNVFPLVGQVLSETFEVDSRLLKTIPKLLIRPGFLSIEFSHNRRAGYLSPFRLYLFTSLLFFFVLSLRIDLPEVAGDNRGTVATGEEIESTGLGEAVSEEPWLRLSIDGNGGDDDDEEVYASPHSTESGTAPITFASSAGEAESADPGHVDLESTRLPPLLTDRQREAFKRLAPAIDDERRSKFAEILRNSALAGTVVQGVERLRAQEVANADTTQRYVVGQMIDILHRPFDAVRAWIENLPIAMFFLLPLFALLLKIFHPNRRWFYSEHLVFAMHNHTVAFLVFTVIALLPDERAGVGVTAQVLVLALLIYYFIAMRNFYSSSRGVTAIKFLALLNLYGFLLLAALIGAAAAVLLFF